MSLAAAFCSRRPFWTLFATSGSNVHDSEHEAGAVKILDMAVVVRSESAVALATNPGIVDVIWKLYLLGSSTECCERVECIAGKRKLSASEWIERGFILVIYTCSAISELILAPLDIS